MSTNYFSHDSNARNDEKLIRLRIRHKAAGYGVYFMLLEILRDKKDFMCVKDYNIIAFELREDAALIKSVVEDFGLFVFTDDGKYFYSESLMNRMEKVGHVSQVRAEAARKRWQQQDQQQYYELMKADQDWISDIAGRHFIAIAVLKEHIDEFAEDSRLRCKSHKDLMDAKEHFYLWLKKNVINKPKQQTNNATTPTKRSDKRRASNATAVVTEAATGKF